MLPVRVSRRSAVVAALAGLAALAALFFWWRARRPFLERWGDDVQRLVSPARIGAEIEALSAKPHRSGTPANAAVADEIARRLANAGLKTWSDVHLSLIHI